LDDTEEAIQHYSQYPRPTRLERRIPLYFEEWLRMTREEEQNRSKTQPTEFKALGSGGEQDEEAWAQWFEYIEWVAEGQPDDLDEPGGGGEDDDEDDDEDEGEEETA
jgi:hypothetical protein